MNGARSSVSIWVGNQATKNDRNLHNMRDLITEKTLMKTTGYAQRGRLIVHLEKYGVSYFVGNRGRIWTTIKAIDRALASGNKDIEDPIEF